MIYPNFLNAAQALLTETYLSIGPQRVDLLTAIEHVERSLGQAREGTQEPAAQPAPAVPGSNDQAILQLQSLMAGVKMK